MRFEIIAYRNTVWNPTISLYGREMFGNGTGYFKQVEIEYPKEPLLTEPGPFISLDPQAAQQLMDSLWDCGLRPSEGSGSAGALLATQNHLKDMQKLTDRLLGMIERHDP